MKGLKEEIKIDQASLITYSEGTVKGVLKKIGIDEMTFKLWQNLGLLSQKDGHEISRTLPAELLFLQALEESGLSWSSVQGLLEELGKPYNCDPSRLYYDVSSGIFCTKRQIIERNLMDLRPIRCDPQSFKQFMHSTGMDMDMIKSLIGLRLIPGLTMDDEQMLEPDTQRDILFFKGILKSGLDWKRIYELLSTLKKPYGQYIDEIVYNVGTDDFYSKRKLIFDEISNKISTEDEMIDELCEDLEERVNKVVEEGFEAEYPEIITSFVHETALHLISKSRERILNDLKDVYLDKSVNDFVQRRKSFKNLSKSRLLSGRKNQPCFQ